MLKTYSKFSSAQKLLILGFIILAGFILVLNLFKIAHAEDLQIVCPGGQYDSSRSDPKGPCLPCPPGTLPHLERRIGVFNAYYESFCSSAKETNASTYKNPPRVLLLAEVINKMRKEFDNEEYLTSTHLYKILVRFADGTERDYTADMHEAFDISVENLQLAIRADELKYGVKVEKMDMVSASEYNNDTMIKDALNQLDGNFGIRTTSYDRSRVDGRVMRTDNQISKPVDVTSLFK